MRKRPCRWLDVGCGTGLAGAELTALDFKVIDGIDISDDMLKVARQRGIYRDLFSADLLAPLPIGDTVYGGAICTGTFTHAHVGAACLDEIIRTLRTGAVFAFTVHVDVYQPAGFAEKLGALAEARVLKELSHEHGIYFAAATEPEGHYFAFEKL